MKRTFSSYGPVNIKSNYYAPRETLVKQAVAQLLGEPPEKGGHYFTVWASRQTGKSWITLEALRQIRRDERFYCVKVDLQVGGIGEDFVKTANYIVDIVNVDMKLKLPHITRREEFQNLFKETNFDRPLVLILDEFDALEPDTIQQIVGEFRNLYLTRLRNPGADMLVKPPHFLHGVCLIGVRSVLGVENLKGSPFNVQRSMHIPNLTFEEVSGMFACYERESGQKVEPEVVERLFYETCGQPGLTSWFGELLTEQYNPNPEKPIGIANWRDVFARATYVLPDNNILNIISKAQNPQYKPTVLDLFRTEDKTHFSFDKPNLNFLYMNGVITYDEETTPNGKVFHAKFPCPYVQKRLFNRFSDEFLPEVNPTLNHFDDLEDAVLPDTLVVPNILKRFQAWLDRKLKKDYFLKDAPRRSDLRVHEAVWHFSLYRFLSTFLDSWKVGVFPEFPTGNGKVDIILHYQGRRYPIEVKSYSNMPDYRAAIVQATRYAKSLGCDRATLVFFIDVIDADSRVRLEREVRDEATGVALDIVFLITGPGGESD